MTHPAHTPARAAGPAVAAGRQPRDPITAIFAAALDGHTCAEDVLRGLACHDDRAADALAAVAYAAGLETHRLRPGPDPADIAAADQTLAGVLARVPALCRTERTGRDGDEVTGERRLAA